MDHEASLILLAIALYVYDSAMLLAPNEAALSRCQSGWRAAFGSSSWRLLGKEVYVPNLLAPQHPLFRMNWSLFGEPPTPLAPLSEPTGIDELAPLVLGSFLCLFVLLPISLIAHQTAVVVAVALTLYLLNITIASTVWRRRAQWRLSTTDALSIGFECVACPPLALNAIRKVCAKQRFDEDFTLAAMRLLSPRQLHQVHQQCAVRLDEQIDWQPEGAPEMADLQATRARLGEVLA